MSNITRNPKGSGMVRRRSDGRWEGRYTAGFDPGTGKQIQRSVYGKTKAEVTQKLHEITFRLDEGTYLEPCRMTIEEWIGIWLESYLNNVKPRTLEIYKDNSRRYIIPYLGKVRLDALTTPMIQSIYNSLLRKKKLAPKTIKAIHGLFHKALKQAMAVGKLRANPADACVLPRVQKKELTPLDKNDIAASLTLIRPFAHALAAAIRSAGVTFSMDIEILPSRLTVFFISPSLIKGAYQFCIATYAVSLYSKFRDLIFFRHMSDA